MNFYSIDTDVDQCDLCDEKKTCITVFIGKKAIHLCYKHALQLYGDLGFSLQELYEQGCRE